MFAALVAAVAFAVLGAAFRSAAVPLRACLGVAMTAALAAAAYKCARRAALRSRCSSLFFFRSLQRSQYDRGRRACTRTGRAESAQKQTCSVAAAGGSTATACSTRSASTRSTPARGRVPTPA